MPVSLAGTAQGTMTEQDVLQQMALLNQEQAQALGARKDQAQAAEQQALQQMQQAVMQPPQQGIPDLASLVQLAGGNLASLIGQSPEFRQKAETNVEKTRSQLLDARKANLMGLQDVYQRRAKEAEEAGDLEMTEKFRAKYETLNKTLESIQGRLERDSRADAAANRAKAGGVEGVDPESIAEGIRQGQLPPIGTNLGRGGVWAAVQTSLAKSGFNLVQAQHDLAATRRHWTQLNSSQQQRLRQATQVAYDSLDIIDSLSGDVSSKVPRGRFPVFNKAALRLAMSGALGPEAQAAANNLNVQINDLQSELAQVFRGGYAPTNEALKQAASQLKGEWSEATLKKATELARKNLRIRLNSIAQTGVISPGFPGNPVGGGGGAPVQQWTRDASGKPVPVSP